MMPTVPIKVLIANMTTAGGLADLPRPSDKSHLSMLS